MSVAVGFFYEDLMKGLYTFVYTHFLDQKRDILQTQENLTEVDDLRAFTEDLDQTKGSNSSTSFKTRTKRIVMAIEVVCFAIIGILGLLKFLVIELSDFFEFIGDILGW